MKNSHSLRHFLCLATFLAALVATSFAHAAIQSQTQSTAALVTPSGGWGGSEVNAGSINGSCANGDGMSSSGLTITGWNFAIPAGATILGIQVRSVSAYAAGSGDDISLVKAGGIAGTPIALGTGNGAGLCSNLIDQTVGTPTELWGTTWTLAEVNDAGFGAFYNNDFSNSSIDGLAITVTYDDGATPTVTINQSAGQADPTNSSTINFTVTFSSAVSGFDGSDVTLGGTAGGPLTAVVTGGPSTYNVAVSGMSSSGTVVATIPVNVVTGGNSASTSTDNIVNFDNVAPTVTINQAVGQADPTNTSPITFSVVFSESVTGFGDADVSLAGSTVGGLPVASVSGSGAAYTVTVTGMSGTGTVIASILASAASDAAGNNSAASTSTDNQVTFDNVPPTVTINQAVGQADPTNTSPISFSVVFSEAVTGFGDADVSFAGSTVGGLPVASVSGSGAAYTVTVTGMSGTGTVIASILASAASDAAGNNSAASTSTDNQVSFDNVPPTVTINQAAGQVDPTNVAPIIFNIVFSEPVIGFTASDVTLTGPAGSTLTSQLFGGPTEYTLQVFEIFSTGTVTASIAAGVATDLAGNANLASTSTDNSVLFVLRIIPTLDKWALVLLAMLLLIATVLTVRRRR